MGDHKILKQLTSFLCAISLLLSLISIPIYAVTAYAVTATTNQTVKQGDTAYCYVYINSTEELAALDVTVHFDPAKVKVGDVYNSISCQVYDSAKKESSIQFSYILDGVGTATKTQLFYFSYQVLSDAGLGSAHFNITIGEAYDVALNEVAVSGSRCNFNIGERTVNKTCSVYGTSAVSTAVAEEFTLNYRFSTYQIASGTAEIHYDPDLFEVVEANPGPFLDGKIADVNASMPGSIYISFVGTEYGRETFLISIKFRTLKNVSESSKITLTASELCDLQLNNINCPVYTTTVNVNYDESYVGDAPTIGVSATYDESTEQVTAVIKLAAKSRLGAGDFVLLFDPTMLTLSSYEKGFTPSFFTVNDKDAANGVLKFSIISMTDIVSEETVLTLTFNTIRSCTEQIALLDFRGSMITDSLTNPILLNFVDGSTTIPEKHVYSSDCDTTCNLCGASRSVDVPHSFADGADKSCENCDHVRTSESISVTTLPNKTAYLEGKDLLDVTGGKITITYDDETTGVIDMIVDMVSGFTNAVVGPLDLTVTYDSCSTSFRVEIIAKSLSSIQVHTMPNVTKYLEAYDSLDLTGGKLQLNYNNGTTDVIALSKAEITGFNNRVVGEQTLTAKYGDCSTSFEVEIVAKSLVSIEITQKPNKLTYLEGDAFDPTGMVVTAYYNNDTSAIVTDYTYSGYDFTPGSKKITVNYNGKTASFTVGVTTKSLVSIEVTQKPTTLTYLEGASFDPTGMVVTAYYNNNTSEVITNYTYSGYDSTPGSKTIAVAYGGQTASFTVNVTPKSLVSIAVTQKPNALTYLEGDVFDPTGMVITAYYNNNTSEVVTGYTVSGYDSAPGTKTIIVTHGGQTASFTVEVTRKSLVSIAVTQKPNTLTYLEGASFDPTGMVITAYYNNNTSEVVTDYTCEGYDSTPGSKTITVTYNGKTASFTVGVTAKSLVSIAVTQKPNTLTYLEGASFDPTGMVVTAYYNNNTSEVVTDYTISGYDSTPGEKTITIAYGGHIASFTVDVKAKSLVSIAVTQLPDRLIYIEDTDFDPAGMVVTAYYNNNTSEVVTDYAYSGYSAAVGEQTITVTYGDQVDEFTVTVEAKQLVAISVTELPDTMAYVEGMAFDSTGMELMLHYNNGTTETILSGWEEEYDFSTPGTKTVLISYGGQTTELSGIVVDNRRVTKISIVTPATKLQYIEGQGLDLAGMTIRADYNDGTHEILNSGWQIKGFDPSTIGEQEVSVHFGGAKATFTVTVKAKSLLSISVETLPNKVVYLEGDAFDNIGLVVKAHYDNGTSAVVTDYTYSGYDSTPGTKTITVAYGEQTASFMVEVTPKSLVSIAVTQKPNKLIYLEGDAFDSTGMVITAYYNNNTSEVVTEYTCEGYDSTPGSKTITVSHNGKIASFTVGVTAKSLVSIAVTQKPNKLTYLEGDAFDSTGMVITAYYNNNTSEVVTDYTYNGYDSTPGTKNITVTYGGQTADFTVEVTPKSLVSIAVTQKPNKLTYLEGDAFDPAGMVITAYYNNNTSEVVTDYTVSGYDSTPGEKTIEITYGGMTANFEVTVKDKSLTGISVEKLPQKVVYLEGEALDIAGLVVKAHYDNGTSETITGYTVSGYSSTPGNKAITVSYKGKETTFSVTVKAKSLTSISVETQPNKVVYLEGDVLDTTGLVIKAHYDNGTSEVITDYTVSGYSSTPGVKTIEISYGGKTTSFEVTVNAKSLTGITVSKNPDKVTYLEGETLNIAGLVVSATYNNGTTGNVTSFEILGYDPNKVGEQTITVTYGSKTATFTVTVVAKTLTGISITSKPNKQTYTQGEELDLSGLVVNATYNNGTNTNVIDYTVSGFDAEKVGQQTITVTYGGKTATFVVTVKSRVPDSITSDVYTVSDDWIRKISAGTKVSNLINSINEKQYIKVFNGNQEVSGDAIVGTGMVVKLMDGNTVKATVTMVVTGDTNGDGKITITDMLAVKSHVLKKTTLSGAAAQAADTSKDGGISITDFIQIKAFILGKGSITAN